MARKRYDTEEITPDEIFAGDDTYDRYGGRDLTGDPLLAAERPRGRRARRQQQERAALKAEILTEIEAGKTAGPTGGDQTGAEDAKKPSRVSNIVMLLLSGNILSRQEVRRVYPYLLFIAFLAFVYIGNVFRMQQLYRRHERLTVEVRELRAKSMTIASEKMKATRQSNIIREIERRGIPLGESLAPNKTIQR
ncbi:MAG: hypothetical protein LIO77_08175 [Rikenellaceae bacterium]|nr:hypothetical protein [Rikenellaceae bacterium]